MTPVTARAHIERGLIKVVKVVCPNAALAVAYEPLAARDTDGPWPTERREPRTSGLRNLEPAGPVHRRAVTGATDTRPALPVGYRTPHVPNVRCVRLRLCVPGTLRMLGASPSGVRTPQSPAGGAQASRVCRPCRRDRLPVQSGLPGDLRRARRSGLQQAGETPQFSDDRRLMPAPTSEPKRPCSPRREERARESPGFGAERRTSNRRRMERPAPLPPRESRQRAASRRAFRASHN